MLRTIFCFAAALCLTLCAPAALGQSTGSTLYAFQGNSDGDAVDASGLIQAWDGNFYGVTFDYGTSTPSTIYRVALNGSHEVLHTFNAASDGEQAYQRLVQGPDGALYGTTFYGGAEGGGTIYRMTLAGQFSVIYNFCSEDNCTDGSGGTSSLTIGSDGLLYGGNNGNFSGNGVVFSVSTSGSYVIRASLPHGAPETLLETSTGNFYFYLPGSGDQCVVDDNNDEEPCGTISSMDGSGTVSVVGSFGGDSDLDHPGPDGYYLDVALVEGPGNVMYGTTPIGGYQNDGEGEDFSLTTGGVFALLPQENGAMTSSYDGFFLASDGNLYNVGNNYFRQVTPSGNVTRIYEVSEENATPIQASDGNFYGIGYSNSAPNGEVYKITNNPALPAPVQLSLSSSTVSPGASVTATFQVLNAFSLTMQQCYAFSTYNGGAMSPLGKVTGTLTNNIYTGSATFTAGAQGTYNFALTCGGVESGFATLTVAGTPTTTAIVANPNPPTVGQPVMLTAQVRRTSGGGFATGAVKFQSGSTLLGTSTLNGSGVATFTASTNGLPPGSYPVTATYEGDSADAASTSPSLPVTLDQAPTTVTLSANPTSVTPPANVILTATVTRSASGATGTPTGTVTFSSGTVTLATVNLNGSGVAAYSASSSGVPAGQYPVTAKYNGDASDTSSTSAAVDVTVK